MAEHDVFGMCNALFDIQAEVDDSDIETLGLQKGGMFLIDEAQRETLVPLIRERIVNTEAGGSGANTMLGASLLGARTCYTSRVGADDFGKRYRDSLIEHGVDARLGVGEGATGISVILLTPDKQRTMLTYLGRSRDLQPEDVDVDAVHSSKMVYLTGYLWDTDNQKEAVLLAMHEAKAAGAKVTFSLSDMFCVDRHRDDFWKLLRKNVDVVFANADEAKALTGTDNDEESVRALAETCEIAAVTMDKRGSILQRGDDVFRVPARLVTPVDTTGAGDMYAAGVLAGLSQGLDLPVAGALGAYAAAQVVAKLGPRLESLNEDDVAAVCAGA